MRYTLKEIDTIVKNCKSYKDLKKAQLIFESLCKKQYSLVVLYEIRSIFCKRFKKLSEI